MHFGHSRLALCFAWFKFNRPSGMRLGLPLAMAASLFFFISALFAQDIPLSNIQVLFSPEDECGKIILDKINSAEKSIELAIYHITSREISKALVLAAKRGVIVRVFTDGENARDHYSKANFLKKNGVLVNLENGEGLMHNKFCIIDDKLLITGSYNWTANADISNDENVIIIDSPEIAKIYRIQFEKYWQKTYVDKAYYIDKNELRKHKSPK